MLHGFKEYQRETLIRIIGGEHEYVSIAEKNALGRTVFPPMIISQISNYPPQRNL